MCSGNLLIGMNMLFVTVYGIRIKGGGHQGVRNYKELKTSSVASKLCKIVEASLGLNDRYQEDLHSILMAPCNCVASLIV